MTDIIVTCYNCDKEFTKTENLVEGYSTVLICPYCKKLIQLFGMRRRIEMPRKKKTIQHKIEPDPLERESKYIRVLDRKVDLKLDPKHDSVILRKEVKTNNSDSIMTFRLTPKEFELLIQMYEVKKEQ